MFCLQLIFVIRWWTYPQFNQCVTLQPHFSSGSITRNEKVPDTITSWYLTGFATNNQYGLGVTEDKTIFKVFKNFFISLNLPYSVKRGEAFLLQIVIFNYLPKKVTTTVTLDNSLKQYEFVDPDSEAYRKKGCPKRESLKLQGHREHQNLTYSLSQQLKRHARLRLL